MRRHKQNIVETLSLLILLNIKTTCIDLVVVKAPQATCVGFSLGGSKPTLRLHNYLRKNRLDGSVEMQLAATTFFTVTFKSSEATD